MPLVPSIWIGALHVPCALRVADHSVTWPEPMSARSQTATALPAASKPRCANWFFCASPPSIRMRLAPHAGADRVHAPPPPSGAPAGGALAPLLALHPHHTPHARQIPATAPTSFMTTPPEKMSRETDSNRPTSGCRETINRASEPDQQARELASLSECRPLG